MAWLTLARIDWARELLETTDVPVERVARLSGLGSPAAFRATFHRHVGTSPADYRATFQHPATGQPVLPSRRALVSTRARCAR